MLGALFLGLFCGVVARMLVPGDMFRDMSGPVSWLISLVLGLVGALLGCLIFTVGLGIGDADIFDWGGVLSALIGTIIVLVIATLVFPRTSSRPSLYPLPWRQASGHDLSHTVIGGGIWQRKTQ